MDKGPNENAHVEFASSEEVESSVDAAPEISDKTDKALEAPSEIVIIPRIVEHAEEMQHDDPELEAILFEEEDEDDKHQHYFRDQIHFNRHKWTKPWFSAVSMIAFSVDLSNLTSFPTNVSRHGGVSYLIIYAIVAIFFVYPLLYLEAVVGQYFQTGMIGIWGVCPIGRGLGVSLFYIIFLIIAILPLNSIWASIMSWEALQSIQSGQLRWVKCDNEWNSCYCKNIDNPLCKGRNYTSTNSPTLEYFVGSVLQMWKGKDTDPITIKDITQNGNWSIAYGFNNNQEGLGQLIPRTCFILLATFILIMIIGLAKPTYIGYFYTFTTIFPMMILTLLICRSVGLDGAFTAVHKYFKMDPSKLVDLSAWHTAFISAFYSIGCGCGCHIVITSFNPLNHNVGRDVIICIVVDTVFSLCSAIVCFTFVGHLYHWRNEPLPQTFPGDNLMFIGLAESFSPISGSSFFATIYYLMVIIITLDTQVVALHAMAYSLYEEYRRKYPDQEVSKLQFIFSVWGLAFSITLMCATRGGYWLYGFLASYMFGFNLIVNMLLENTLLIWIWGIEDICVAFETILGHRPSVFMRILWKYALPVAILTFLLYMHSQDIEPVSVFGQEGPKVTARLGFVFQYITLTVVGLYSFYVLLRLFRGKSKTCLQILVLLISPEYEHADITENVKKAKRLHWRHYTFLYYDDEIKEIKRKNKERMQKVLEKFRKLGSFCANMNKCIKSKQPVQVSSPSAKLKSKKEKKKKKKGVEANENDNLWSKLEKEKEETHSDASEKAKSTSSKKKKGKQRRSATSILDKSKKIPKRKNKVKPESKSILKR